MLSRHYLVIGIFPCGKTIHAGPYSHYLVADKASQLLLKWYPRLKLTQVVEEIKPIRID